MNSTNRARSTSSTHIWWRKAGYWRRWYQYPCVRDCGARSRPSYAAADSEVLTPPWALQGQQEHTRQTSLAKHSGALQPLSALQCVSLIHGQAVGYKTGVLAQLAHIQQALTVGVYCCPARSSVALALPTSPSAPCLSFDRYLAEVTCPTVCLRETSTRHTVDRHSSADSSLPQSDPPFIRPTRTASDRGSYVLPRGIA